MSGRDRVQIHDAVERVVAVLEGHPVSHGTEIVAEVEGVGGGLYPGEHPGPGGVGPDCDGGFGGHAVHCFRCNRCPSWAVRERGRASAGPAQRPGGPVSDELAAREAIRQAYQAYYRRLVATMYGLTADHGEAQDLVQEAYARALARPKIFLDVADPEAWLRTVAVNLARTRWRRRRLLDTMIRTGRVTPTPESVPGADPNRVLLVAALAKLSRPTRETIVLHHIADMSVHEVAEQLGVPVSTVKARLSRGRALLAELLHEAAPTAAVPSPDPAAARADAVFFTVVRRRVGFMPFQSTAAPHLTSP